LFDTTVAGRSAKIKGIENMVGLFINTLPIRQQREPGDTITDYLKRTANMLPKWNQYENSSRLQLNEYLEENQTSQPNLFDTLMVIENYPLDKQTLQAGNALAVETFSYSGRTLYDITVIITDIKGLQIEMTYNKELFDKEAAKNMSRYYSALLTEILNNTDKEVSALDIVPEKEKKRIIEAVNKQHEAGHETESSEYIAPRN
ncbi:MAG: hypothetical protein GY757_55340, partial [bacterium]|nr:hypothetical protein [bacterium]